MEPRTRDVTDVILKNRALKSFSVCEVIVALVQFVDWNTEKFIDKERAFDVEM
jgi:hypothetical protein